MQTPRNLQHEYARVGVMQRYNLYGMRNLATISKPYSKSSGNEELFYQKKKLLGDLEIPVPNRNEERKCLLRWQEIITDSADGQELSNIERKLNGDSSDQQPHRKYLPNYNRQMKSVSRKNPMQQTTQPSNTNTMGIPGTFKNQDISSILEKQLAVTKKLPQFSSFESDNWFSFITEYIPYTLSAGLNSYSISDLTTIQCKLQTTMFFDVDIWESDNTYLQDTFNSHFSFGTHHRRNFHHGNYRKNGRKYTYKTNKDNCTTLQNKETSLDSSCGEF